MFCLLNLAATRSLLAVAERVARVRCGLARLQALEALHLEGGGAGPGGRGMLR